MVIFIAEFNTTGLEEIEKLFGKMDEVATRAVPKMLEAGGTVLVEAQKAEAEAMGLKDTSGFINSIKATKVKEKDGAKYIEVYPQGKAKHGNDRKGSKENVRYATIGFVAEYGTTKIQARPYMTAANAKSHDKVIDAEMEVWERELNG